MKKTIILCWLFLVIMAGCKGNRAEPVYEFKYQDANVPEKKEDSWPQVRFAVISDPHTYDPSLGTEGEAFEEYLKHDRKLLAESERILGEAFTLIRDSGVIFVIVPGDLTKDGATVSHMMFADYMARLEKAGIEVYVVPGNHDMVNTHAVKFDSEKTIPVEHVVRDSFKKIYKDLGYDKAIMEDEHSVSYVAEPVPGLWLLALDSAITTNNIAEDYPNTDGEFNHKTAAWIEDVLINARMEGKAVIPFFHHALVPHWEGQEKLHPEYILNGYQQMQALFAHYGVKMVFTGHYHAQDVAKVSLEDGNWVYDIMTGSLVTYPCPIRYIEIQADNMVRITSDFVTTIPDFEGDFESYARDTVFDGVYTIAMETIMGYRVNEPRAEYISKRVASAYLSHYRGDENPQGDEASFSKKGMGLMGRLVINNQSYVLEGLWKDTDGADNELTIDLNTGEWK
jgi:UDP-2,3-diacylglucosamine pyrophosphatase LpxH